MSDIDFEVGTCCFCGLECNPLSQSCGRCSISLTSFSIGLSPTIPDHLKKFITPKKKDMGKLTCPPTPKKPKRIQRSSTF